jgi:MerR family transcriptional regulator, light-induced transcriptional regulator
MEPFLSPRDVAQAIGVSESSLKRWADEGLLSVSRTAGGHRRIALREVLRYLRETGMPVARPEILGLPGISNAAPGGEADEHLIACILQGYPDATRGALMGRYLAGESLASLCDGPLREALRRVGELWQHGPEGVHIEHRATDTCIHALNYLRGMLAPPAASAPLALGCSPGGDPYIIPSLMAAVVLAAEGWREINLGANLPAPALTTAMQKFRPRLVWVSFSAVNRAGVAMRELTEAVRVAEEIGASFIAGGRALPPRSSHPPAPFQVLPSMEALAGFARGLATTPPGKQAPQAPDLLAAE